MLESDHSYKGKQSNCIKDPSKYINMKVNGYKKLGNQYSQWLSPWDEKEVKELLYKNGPLNVPLNSCPLIIYVSGIINESTYRCPAKLVDHLALLIGYGYDKTTKMDYWIFQNCWGEQGYFRIRRGIGTCNINSFVFSGLDSFDWLLLTKHLYNKLI